MVTLTNGDSTINTSLPTEIVNLKARGFVEVEQPKTRKPKAQPKAELVIMPKAEEPEATTNPITVIN